MLYTYRCKAKDVAEATAFSVRDAMLVCCRNCPDIEDCNGNKLADSPFEAAE